MSSITRNLVVGGAAVVAADQLGSMIPLAPLGFPVGKWLAAIGGVYLGEKLMGGGAGWKKAAILGVTALAAAELKDQFAGNVQFALPVLGDGARILAGGLGLWAASSIGIEAPA